MGKHANPAIPVSKVSAETKQRRAKRAFRSARSSLNPAKEALVSVGIYVLLATPVDIGLAVWRLGSWSLFCQRVGVPETLGRISGQATLLVVLLAVLAYLRQRAGTPKFILLDWKWWLIALGLCLHPAKPIVNWLGTGLIYQYRERKGRRANLTTSR